ncbi:hypothetical protein B0H14DRAFT_3423552 [Mycena olivaceomarginata]|nr:hypothetical protein B0H14DRAFT_3423552 [Mycena olivaceomarginata]
MSQLLPSVLTSHASVSDVTTTADDLNAAQGRAKVTSPKETPLFICALPGKDSALRRVLDLFLPPDCFRLFPSRDRVMTHRKRDHNSDETDHVITWNE